MPATAFVEDPVEKWVRDLTVALGGADPMPGFKAWNNNVIVVKYIRNTHGKSGKILAAPSTQREDQWQGKVGYVVKVGPSAFVDDKDLGIKFYGQSAKPGDWIMYRASDGSDWDYVSDISRVNIHCSILQDSQVMMTVPRPDLLF